MEYQRNHIQSLTMFFKPSWCKDCKIMQEIEISRLLFELQARYNSQFGPSISTSLPCFGLVKVGIQFFAFFFFNQLLKWYFVSKIVLTYSEKESFKWFVKTFKIRGWRLRICKTFEFTIHSNSERPAQFLTCSWKYLRSYILEQLEFKLEKIILSFYFRLFWLNSPVTMSS